MPKIYAVSHFKFIDLLRERGITDATVSEQKGTVFIQILTTRTRPDGSYVEEFILSTNDDNAIALRFDDIDEPLTQEEIDLGYVPVHPMSEVQALQLAEFIHHNTHRKTFLVHCTAGESRSGGVARFLAEYFDVPLADFAIDNPYVRPNQRIVSLLRKQMTFISSQKIPK